MGKYLEIAQRALNEQSDNIAELASVTTNQSLASKRQLTSDSTRCEISEISEISERSPVGDDELKVALEGAWGEVSKAPDQLEVARMWVTEAKQVGNGIIPERYTQTSDCKYCGPVFVVEGYPLKANNCPWCLRRIKGLQIPTPTNDTYQGK